MKYIDLDDVPERKQTEPLEMGLGPSDVDGLGDLLKCPICGFEWTHLGVPVMLATDNGRAWGGRGNCLVIPVNGECGHSWNICIGYHKGQNFIFIEADRVETRDEGDRQDS